MLGCFQPGHRCIDNVIHSTAGPRLRDACHSLMLAQKHFEPVGSARVTKGFDLPASWILHTVGPQLSPKDSPKMIHKNQLAQCYISCLEAAQSLPPLPDGRKVLVFCCISTGIFAFPSNLAAKIALETVTQWCIDHSDTTLTDIIFDTFLKRDWQCYNNNICTLKESHNYPDHEVTFESSLPQKLLNAISTPAVMKARAWIEEVDYLIITAGAGLSAAIGLDYTSEDLFEKHFPAFRYLGLSRLYDVFGFQEWDNLRQKWGYYFLHLEMVRTWPTSTLYATLCGLANRFESKYFVRTSNADGQFVNNGFAPERISTPQGQYKFLQCFAKCRSDAVFPSAPFIDAALPFIDPDSQVLTDESKVPRCQYCGGELTICFLAEVSQNLDGKSSSGNTAVVLELGVGLNTPGVLRWPNEKLVEESSSSSFRLIRAGIGASGCAPWDLEEENLAIGISGDLNIVINALTT
ncbi:hypothetical protein B7463_g3992, partial [Scytalidium lignicola]